MNKNPEEPLGTAIDALSVRIERVLPGPVERVWAYLTEPDKRARWLAGGDMELRPGAEIALCFRHSELSHEPAPERWRGAEGHVNHSHVTRCEPPTLLAITWPSEGEDSEVTFELTPQGDEVLLVVTHRRLADKTEMTNVASGWHAHLAILADQLHGRQPRGFWSTFAAAEAAYQARFTER